MPANAQKVADFSKDLVISREDFNAITSELARLRLMEKATRNLLQAESALRQLIQSTGQ